MKGKFVLKIADLLRGIGKDEIVFDENGMQGVLELDGIDDRSVLIKLLDFKTESAETCDRCGKQFKRLVKIPEYIAKYTLDKTEFEESTEDVVFMIDSKNETIDVEELLYQASHLDDPFVIKCPDCEKSDENNIENNDDFDTL
ncbi:hypothetical protein AGMMS50249_1060 [candidate division SR1 bacterium]|nr:hypothetical protein AGMMS50249_1060 [candidate division SR1 bacterium]